MKSCMVFPKGEKVPNVLFDAPMVRQVRRQTK